MQTNQTLLTGPRHHFFVFAICILDRDTYLVPLIVKSSIRWRASTSSLRGALAALAGFELSGSSAGMQLEACRLSRLSGKRGKSPAQYTLRTRRMESRDHSQTNQVRCRSRCLSEPGGRSRVPTLGGKPSIRTTSSSTVVPREGPKDVVEDRPSVDLDSNMSARLGLSKQHQSAFSGLSANRIDH